MTTNEELRVLVLAEVGGVLVEELTQPVVGIDDIGDALGGVEASHLYDVVAFGPLELIHLLLRAEAAELSHVVLGVPRIKLLVETIEPSSNVSQKIEINKTINIVPVGGSAEEAKLLERNIFGHEFAHRVAWVTWLAMT